jgi:hypothetical protein
MGGLIHRRSVARLRRIRNPAAFQAFMLRWTETIMPIDPLTLGRIRAGRDDGRPTEDDIARERAGEQGIPGKAKAPLKSDERLQNPKPIDPGHTA